MEVMRPDHWIIIHERYVKVITQITIHCHQLIYFYADFQIHILYIQSILEVIRPDHWIIIDERYAKVITQITIYCNQLLYFYVDFQIHTL